jgi:hypothetical protein
MLQIAGVLILPFGVEYDFGKKGALKVVVE